MTKAVHRGITYSFLIRLAPAMLGLLPGMVVATGEDPPELLLPVGHTDCVRSVSMTVDGRCVLTGSFDKTAILWDVISGKPLRTFKGHTDYISSVALSLNGERMLTGSGDKTAILWDATSDKPLRTFKGHADYVSSVALSLDGKRVLTGSGDKTAILWDADLGKSLQTFKGHTDSIFSVSFHGTGNRVLTGSRDKTAILWDADTAKSLQRFHGHNEEVNSVSSSLDGNRVLTGSSDKYIILWDVNTGKSIQRFEGHSSFVTSVALSLDGKHVLTGSADNTAILWDANTGRQFQTFKGHTSAVNSLALNVDGKCILTGSDNKTAMLWDVSGGKPLQTLKGEIGSGSVALSLNGRLALTGAGWHATLWDAVRGESLHSYLVGVGVAAVAMSPYGRHVVTADLVGNDAILWDTQTGTDIQTFKGHGQRIISVALSVNGKRVVTGSLDKTAILWSTDTGKPLQTFKKHTEGISSVALSVDGKQLLTGSWDSTAILWNADTGKPLQTFKGHSGHILSVAISPTNTHYVTAAQDGTVRIWKAGREQPVISFMAAGGEWLFWTPEGYYNCSPNGESLIAWMIRDDSPQGYRIVTPDQFRERFRRPNLFRYLLRELDLPRALALADQESGHLTSASLSINQALSARVYIAKPLKSKETIETDECEISAKAFPVGDNRVTSLQLLINGQETDDYVTRFDERNTEPPTVTWKVKLVTRETLIQARANTVKGTKSTSEPTKIVRIDKLLAPPTLLLLAVGVTDYKKTNRRGVEYASADAKKFFKAQIEHGKRLYPSPDVITLVDGTATREQIIKALDDLRRKASKVENPVTIIFLAGHGQVEGEKCYFLGADSDPESLLATAISGTVLTDALTAIPGKVVVFLDSCHSGAFAQGLYWHLMNSRDERVVLICSAGANEKSGQSSSNESGYFTQALVEGLSGQAKRDKNGGVTLSSLFMYILEVVPKLSKNNRDGPHRPYVDLARLNKLGDLQLTMP